MPTEGYRLKVYSHAGKYKSEAKMALKSIELRDIPFKKTKEQTVIFDGKYLEGTWKPYEAYKHFFAEFSRFKNNALVVNVPEKNNLGQVGIESSDTIIDLTERNQPLAYHLKFKFDPQNTTGFAIDLEGKNLDKSHSYNRLQIFYKKIDDKSAMLELHKDGELHTKLEMDAAPESLELVILPNNVMYLHLPDGRYLQTTSIKYPMPTKGYTVRVYSKPKERHLASKISLKSIELKRMPFEKKFDPSNLREEEKRIVLFDGKFLEERWIPYNEQYKDYLREFGKFSDHKLIIDVPKDHKWGEAGICSPEPLVWLDNLSKDGEVKVTFRFDPLQTTGFSIAAGGFNHSWKTPWDEYIGLSWTKVEDKDISKLKFKIKNNLLLDENLTGKAPSTITLSFKNEEIGIEGDTFGKKTFVWPYLIENRALHLWAYSHAFKKDLPVKMALKKIVLDRKFGVPIPLAKPDKGVAKLPVKEICGSNTIDKWECIEGKNKENYCTMSDLGFVINVPKESKNSSSIRSKKAIIDLDKRRINTAKLKMVMQFNPKKTDNFDITIGNEHIYFEKTQENIYTLRLGKYLSRNIQAEWIETLWNGKINILLSKNSIEVEVDENIGINIPKGPQKYFDIQISTNQINSYMKSGANLELRNITTQWMAPDGMNTVDRWNYINDEDFDPDEFLRELKEGK